MTVKINDPYTTLAARLFKTTLEQVTKEQRRYAKEVVYRNIYSAPTAVNQQNPYIKV